MPQQCSTAQARRTHGSVPGLAFMSGDAYNLPCRGMFDVVTAARVLQWLAHPLAALQAMCAGAKPGGWVVTLDQGSPRRRGAAAIVDAAA